MQAWFLETCRSPRWPALVVAALVAVLAAGCASEPAQVRVIVDADDAVRAMVTELRVQVRGSDDNVTDRTTMVGDDNGFPFEVPVVPLEGDASRRFSIEVTAVGAAGVLATLRAATGFDGGTRYVHLRFTEACVGVTCGGDTTCEAGACVSPCVVASTSRSVSSTDCSALPDAGFDGPPPNPACAPIANTATETFEGALPALCPDFPSPDVYVCSHATHDGLEVVDATGARGPGERSPCGSGRVLRVESNGATSASLIGLPTPSLDDTPGPRWARAMFYVPASSLDILRSSGTNQSLMSWTPDRQVVGGNLAVNLRWSAGNTLVHWAQSTPLVQDVSSYSFEYPADRWFCLEFGLDGAANEAQPALDGTLFAPSRSENVAPLFPTDQPNYVRIGLFSGGIPAVIYLDDLVAGTERIPCP